MVNLPLKAMDDYGLIEPTDVGTISIDYDSKEDAKRKINRWDHEETVCMLTLIKENNFISRYSVIKMSTLLSQMMQKKGYTRTDKQIQMKLTTLRKNFLAFKRQKVNSNNTKECPFYKELNEIYSNTDNTNGYDSEDSDSNYQDECLINFPNDPMEWTKAEVQKMLNQIKYMKLKNELSLTFFSPVAVKMIAEAMQKAGYDRSTNSVRNALINLRSMYIDYKVGCENNENPPECLFFSCLDMYWGREFKKCRMKEKKKQKAEETWNTEETIVLLTLIQDLNIVEEAYKNTDKAAEDIRVNLGENGFIRTKQQVAARLLQLKRDYVSVHACSEAEAVRRFPFYNLYKKLFERHITKEVLRANARVAKYSSSSSKDSLESSSSCSNSKDSAQNQYTTWVNDEVRILLKTIQEMTSKSQQNDSLEDEKLQKLIKVLGGAGYNKTAEQIKRKLALLKSTYLKCNQEDSTENDIFNCPFYNELHSIFHTPVSDQRYEFIQNLLAENSDISTSSKFPDHSYTNVKFGNGSLGTSESRTNDKVTVVPNKCIDTWFPVESIIADERMSPSTSLDLNNISSISNREQEQVVEEAILESFPQNGDSKNEEDQKILNNSSLPPDLKNVNIEDHIPTINDIAYDQEIETTTEDNNVDCVNVYNIERPESKKSEELTSLPTPVPDDEDSSPPRKKPRIVEDERISKNNKILLRPMDGDSTSLNISKPTSKFVRLIVANDRPNNRSSLVNHITAHIEPLSVNVTAATSNSTVSSELNSPVDRLEAAKLAAEKLLKDDVLAQRLHCDKSPIKQAPRVNGADNHAASGGCSTSSNIEEKVSQTIIDAVQTMMKHNEVLQQRHHTWMEQQFEIQRKHDEEQKNAMMKEFQELRKSIAVLIASKMPHANSQHRPNFL